jgi:hypothetical protein
LRVEKRWHSLEALTQAELRALDEMPISADADRKAWFSEGLDESEYGNGDFLPAELRGRFRRKP